MITTLSVSCAGQVSNTTDSGELSSSTPPITAFSTLEVSGTYDAEVRKGAPSLTINADAKTMKSVRVEQVGDVLRLYQESNWRRRNRSGHPKVIISTPDLQSIAISGAAKMKVVDPLQGDIDLSASGAASLRAPLSATTVKIDGHGASSIELLGVASRLELKGSGSSDFEMDDLQAEEASVELSGASDATFSAKTVSVELSGASDAHVRDTTTVVFADLSGASGLLIPADAKIQNLDTSGSSRVRRR